MPRSRRTPSRTPYTAPPANPVAAAKLRRTGALVDVELHLACNDGSACPPVRGKGLIDGGADRTAVEVSQLDPRARASGTYLAQGATSGPVALPVYPVRLRFPGAPIGDVEIEGAAGTPALKSQGLLALLGRDLLAHGVYTHDGPRGTFELRMPEDGVVVRRAHSSSSAYVIGGALALAFGGATAWLFLG